MLQFHFAIATEIGFALQEPVPSCVLLIYIAIAGGYRVLRYVKQRPVVHPFYHEMKTKIIKERVKTLTKRGGEVSLGHQRTGEALVVCDTDK